MSVEMRWKNDTCPHKSAGKQDRLTCPFTSLPPYCLSQMVRPRQHTFRLSTRQPSKVELDPLSIQVRAHINLLVARGVYAHILYTVWKWTVTDSQIPAWRGLFLQNNASQTLRCTHIAQGSRFTAALGRGPGVSISNTFRWCQGYGPTDHTSRLRSACGQKISR